MTDFIVPSFLQTLRDKYRKRVLSTISERPVEKNALKYWRDHLFASTIYYLIPLSIIALVPGMYLAYTEGLTFLVIADIFAIVVLLSVAFVPGINISLRKVLFGLGLYAVTIALLFYLGTFGPGLMYLLAITVFIVLITDQKYGVASVIFNGFICGVFGFAMHNQWWGLSLTGTYTIESWIAVSVNLIFLGFLAVLLIPKLFTGLQTTIEKQKKLQSDLEKSRDELKYKNNELEQFTYVVSHDLKEPLRMVKSFVTLLDKRYSEEIDDRGKKYIHLAVDGADRLTQFIDDLLEYSRVGRVHSTFKQVDLNDVIHNIKTVFESQPDYRGSIEIEKELPEVHAVPVTMKMLFQNLVSNGLKYQPEHAEPLVKISSEDAGTHWKFRVSDNGIGIEEKYIDQIFEMFNRLQSNDVYSGTGVGLAICRKIVDLHKGRIWAESTVGEGTDFIFTLKK